MGLDLEYLTGQTPLDEDEKEGLLIRTITNRGELDEHEQQNIEDAIYWSLKTILRADSIFSEVFLQKLHVRMFGKVWKWVGEYRKSNKNIGVDRWMIASELRVLLDDVRYWHNNKIYPPDELAIRFKHRLVSIHCFPNGNGRHSRLVADIVISKVYGMPLFTWGAAGSETQTEQRARYIKAMKAADQGDIQALLIFARS